MVRGDWPGLAGSERLARECLQYGRDGYHAFPAWLSQGFCE